MLNRINKEINKIYNSTELTDHERNTYIYKKWSKEIKQLAGFKCVCCGSTENLVSHHALCYRDYPKLRLDLLNGVCLCKKCHIEYHKQYPLDNTSPATLIAFIKAYQNDL